MGHDTIGKVIFPMNAGFNESDITDNNTSYDYDNHTDQKAKAFMSVSVNPKFVQNNLLYENSIDADSTQSIQNSANFMEIRKTSHGTSISNDYADKIGNRILPTTATLTDYGINRDETHPFKVKAYDSTINDTEINRKFVYSTTDYPASSEIGLDIENYDYFILLNPQLVEAGNDLVRPHLAKITRIVAFDEFGDGLEFSPSYTSSVPLNTKFEIFKGPIKTDTDVVAVSYGLRGDTSATTPKYDRVNICSLPTWYFYNDRLDEKNQLDYMTKYNATHLRWWAYSTTISITSASSHDQYSAGSTSLYYVLSEGDWDKLVEGQSIYNNSNTYIGNVASKYTDTTYRFFLDYARVAVSAISSATDFKIGKTVQNVIFRTEGKFSNTIQNKGKERLDANLVDANYSADTNASTDFYKWTVALPKMHRHTANLLTSTVNTIDGDLTGSSKYLTFEKANFKNNKISLIQDAILNNPRNKMSQLASFTTLDNSGLQHLKVQEEDTLILQRNVHNDNFNMIAFEGIVSRHASETNKFVLSNIRKETDLRHILSTNDIIELDGYYYVIDAVSAQSSGTQAFTIKDKKLKAATVWTGSAVAENISQKTLYLTPYTGVINFTLEADTEVDYASNRISIDGNTIDKDKTKLYNARLVSGLYNSHVNEIDYADKDNKFVKVQDSDRVFYQRSNESQDRFYYYVGGYSISDTVFTGIVEDISSSAEHGLTKFQITGRDDTSKLLSGSVTKNNVFMNDVIKTSIPPLLNDAVAITGISSLSVSGTAITWSDTASITPVRHGLILNQVGALIGEVKNYTTGNITLYNSAYTTATSLKYYHPYSSTYINYITGTKALESNELHTTGMSGFLSISEKGLVFNDGLKIDGTFTGSSSSFTYSKLLGASNTGNFLEDKTLGYDLSSPKSISTDDSKFAFTVGDENGVTVTKNDIAALNSESFDVISINEKSESVTNMEIAPIFPVVLGRLNSNTSDTRGNCNIYLVNNNINTGGFIHRLQNYFIGSGFYGPTETIRYWDLQKFKAGTITKTFDNIYNDGKMPQKIQGYAVGYGVRADGTTFTPTVTTDNKPINGSNTINGWTHLNTGNFYQSELIQSYTPYEGGTTEYDIEYEALEHIDPRTDSYEFLAVGDIFPNSKLRHNNLNYHTKNYEDFGLLLETHHIYTGNTTHEKYTGSTGQTLKTENMFEESSISSATQTTNQSRRYGVIRLVEATFDWHFNPLDFESLKHTDEIPTIPYFDYVMMNSPILETSTNSITLDRGSDVNVTSNSVTETDGDMFYSTDYIGENPDAVKGFTDYANESNGFIAVKKAASWGSANSGNHNLRGLTGTAVYDDILRFDGHNDNGIKWYGVTSFPLYRTTDYNIDNLDTRSVNYKSDRYLRKKDIRFTNVFITRGDSRTSKFEFANLESNASGYYAATFDAHNVILPLIPQEKRVSAANNQLNHTTSFWHHPDSWMGNVSFDGGHKLHMSRVINALVERTRSDGTGITKQNKYGLGMTSTSDAYFAHPYDNCIALFKDVKLAMEGNSITLPDISLTSAPLALDTDARYQAYITDLNNDVGSDQSTRNAMLQPFDGSTDIIMGGTKTNGVFLSDKNTASTAVATMHQTAAHISPTGLVASAQMIVKPTFTLTDSTIAISNQTNESTLVLTLNGTSKHIWMSFMPNLTGYYLVSERLTTSTANASDVTIRTNKNGGIPSHIAKIISHTVSTTPSNSAIEIHTIKLDDTLDTSWNTTGSVYRLMRVSETTFNKQSDYIEFNTLKKMSPSQHFKTGEDGTEDFEYQESVWTMHLLLDIDSGNSEYLEHRTATTAIGEFTHLEKIRMNFTDGENSAIKIITVSTKRPTLENISEGFKSTPEVATENGLTMSFEDKLNGNGIVSIGEIFELTLSRRPKLRNIKKCHIGTTYTIGSQIEKEVENLVKEAGLEYNTAKSFSIPTGNLVNSNTSTTVVCSAAVENVAVGEVLYSYDGHLIGEVSIVSGSTITFTKKYYTPIQYDELIKINKRTFVTNLKFDDSNLYSAINSLVIKKGLDYTIKNGEFITRNIDDTSSLRKFALSYAESSRLISVKSNKSMFDKANKVIVIGDRIKYELEKETTNQTRVVKVIDPTIKTRTDAEVRAVEIMNLHSEDVRKITIVVQKKGLELLEAGDIVRLNFPNHNIPINDYIVFEIENVLAGALTLIVGTFDKTIAERLSEISLQQSDSNTTHFKRDAIEISAGKFLFDAIKLKDISFSYAITGSSNALSRNSNMGFDDIVGFTEEVGFEHSTVIKKSFDNKFYEQEAYGGLSQ